MKMTHFLPLILCFGCANIVPLSGGDIDKTPPQLLAVCPKNESILFEENKIKMVFDEAIQINPTEKVFFSPYIHNEVKLDVRGKELSISINDDLEENTTYTIILNNLVKDVTEGNVLANLDYTFSTGSSIDTLYIEGVALDALSKTPLENVCVGLFSSNTFEDSLLYKQVPEYLALSDKDGRFKFSNLPDKEFMLYALEDLDNNLKFTLPQEKVGFLSKPLGANQKGLTVLLFDETAIADSLKNEPSDENTKFGRLIIDALPNAPLIVELIQKESVVYRASSSTSLTIDSLSAGTYSLRIIYDDNQNETWDSGNLLNRQQAEVVNYHPKEIIIRADWDVIVEWETNE